VRGADIVVAAIGKPAFVRTDWVKEGAIVLDVGINRIAKADGKHGLCGDVDYAALTGKVSAMTPVPGGVGPMTVACLLQNTYQACLTLV
jgi:methylenetetrahydrofolate dehydrogenase (NADP+)/methenyltetrahydrofolate cyclohydrolase